MGSHAERSCIDLTLRARLVLLFVDSIQTRVKTRTWSSESLSSPRTRLRTRFVTLAALLYYRLTPGTSYVVTRYHLKLEASYNSLTYAFINGDTVQAFTAVQQFSPWKSSDLEFASAIGLGNARAVASMYSAMACRGYPNR